MPDAGDTYAYDEDGKKTQAQREQKAAKRLYGLLPEDQGAKLKAIWEEFEAKNTPESRFAHTMDNLQPVNKLFFIHLADKADLLF